MKWVFVVICDFEVGRDRTEMSIAVPRRMGTRGVSSKAMSGECDSVCSFSDRMTEVFSEKAFTSSTGLSAEMGLSFEWAADIS